MLHHTSEDLTEYPRPALGKPGKKGMAEFFARAPLGDNQPALIQSSSTPLFRLEKCPEKYAHLLKKKDLQNIGPIVNYFINNSGHIAYLGGDVVKNLYLHGRRKYITLSILIILTSSDVDKYSSIMNNIISSNDGDFSLGFKYHVRKNRGESCFREIACNRYIIEPRLEGPEKLLYLFRPSAIELDLTTKDRFSEVFGVEVR